MESAKKEIGPLHCLYFIYYSFTTSTDENYNESQIHKITTYLNEWTNDKNTSEAIIQETLEWVKESQIAKSEFINVMLSMVDYLNDEQRFSLLQKNWCYYTYDKFLVVTGVLQKMKKSTTIY